MRTGGTLCVCVCPTSVCLSLSLILILSHHLFPSPKHPPTDRLRQDSPEAFAVRLIRQGHPTVGITGLSAIPHALKSSTRVEQVCGYLGASRLVLWPRFQVDVARVLEGRAPEVIELWQPLTEDMRLVQQGIGPCGVGWAVAVVSLRLSSDNLLTPPQSRRWSCV